MVALATSCLAPTRAAAQAPPAEPPGSVAVVMVARLNVRAEPRLDAQTVGSAVRGDTLCALSVSSDWVEVRTPAVLADGVETRGFVARGLVSEARVTAGRMRELGCAGSPPLSPDAIDP